ncbi:MAG TPA: DUF928 domain-containing protein [Oscillatoriales cyanobacterium M59_W2019_021]|nr:MAG: DUF928 domain-containing protein [Cyanobacteria bacterium J055]HIK33843.1 DUF928 domain-containing protein [Oscillatoriales cyanobacterium M4454_W2019_049]HIK53555.1 DUF928 domain-containing protein [Oscillatoriales cyanobacterium M59_W2019_021]
MKHQRHPFLNLIPILIFLETIALWTLPQPARSQTLAIDLETPQTQAFEPPPDDGEPESTAGGGSRNDSCLTETEKVAVVLEPASEDLPPRVSIVLPPTTARALVVKIEDDRDHLVYYDIVTIDRSSAASSPISPDAAVALEAGEKYHWTISAICGEILTVNDPTAEGSLVPQAVPESSLVGIEAIVAPPTPETK